jgi:P pilus assembly chaperone PapD
MRKSGLIFKIFGSVKSISFILLPSWFILLTLLFCNDIMAQGNLLIMPRRVVFEGSKKSEDLTLVNTGKDTSKYVVSIVQLRMKEDGSVEPITKPDSGQYFADKYLRFFPRTVLLGPNETQLVKMQLTRADKLSPGEYRSHVYFRAIPKETPLGETAASKDTSNVSIQLKPVFGITIPVIIRTGENTTKVSLIGLSLEMSKDTVPKFKLTFKRTGNMSVFGDLKVEHISAQGTVTAVGLIKGIAVYTPLTERRFQANLDKVPGIDWHSGKLRVIYETPVDVKAAKLAEAELVLK